MKKTLEKPFYGLFMAMLLLFFHAPWSWAGEQGQGLPVTFPGFPVIYRGVAIQWEREPFLYENHLYVPLREMAKALSLPLIWEEHNQRIEISPQNVEALITPGNPWAGEETLYGQVMKIDYGLGYLTLEQLLDDQNRTVFDSLYFHDDTLTCIKRNHHSFPVTPQDVKVGDMVEIIINQKQEIQRIILHL